MLLGILIALATPKDAVDHLKKAVDLDSHEGDDAVLARLLASQGRIDDAGSYLDRAAKTPGLSPPQRQTVAVLMARQGETEQALELLKSAADELDPDGQLVLAELSRKHGDIPAAETIYTNLLKSPSVSAEALRFLQPIFTHPPIA